MKIAILSIGKWKGAAEEALYKKYEKRLPCNFVTLYELGPFHSLKQESQALIHFLQKGDCIVALDEHGDNLSTNDFVQFLSQQEFNSRTKRLVFVIGGAQGLESVVKRQAHKLISFGRMTWPHLLVRSLLMEQIYRAQQIQKGHPYHKEGPVAKTFY